MPENIEKNIKNELEIIWSAHKKHGLKGKMKLYTITDKEPMRAAIEGYEFWFGPDETDAAVSEIVKHFNNGKLPNTPLLLNPMVHDKDGKPIGSGIAWATVIAKGIATLTGKEQVRLSNIDVYSDHFNRAENKKAGLKIIAFTDKIVKPEANGEILVNKALYDLCDIDSEEYYQHYMISGISYLTKNGMFLHPDISNFGPVPISEEDLKASRKKNETLPKDLPAITKPVVTKIQTILDAALCWNSYDRHNTLYERFGINTNDIERNLKYFRLCARNFDFFYATGPQRKGAEETFDFVVDGLIPRGTVTVLAGAGGTGKSSIAHELCVKAAIDYDPGEEADLWLGQKIRTDNTKGICVYFSGEDGPAVINARGELFDPRGRANRLMFQRTEFRDREETLPEFMAKLSAMPEVSIMVIDPARKYLEGDENDSEVVSNFFEAIEEFAIKKNCAMIIVHHLEKSANPKSARDILDLLRGSQVFIDRARVVLGLYRDGPYTIVGLAKCNIPPNLGMVTDERVFARDPKTLQLVWLPGEKGIRRTTLSEEELEQLKAEAELAEVNARNKKEAEKK